MMNRKYDHLFNFFDDYVMWLFYEYCDSNKEKYYQTLEHDLWEYVDMQNGKEREKRDRLVAG